MQDTLIYGGKKYYTPGTPKSIEREAKILDALEKNKEMTKEQLVDVVKLSSSTTTNTLMYLINVKKVVKVSHYINGRKTVYTLGSQDKYPPKAAPKPPCVEEEEKDLLPVKRTIIPATQKKGGKRTCILEELDMFFLRIAAWSR